MLHHDMPFVPPIETLEDLETISDPIYQHKNFPQPVKAIRITAIPNLKPKLLPDIRKDPRIDLQSTPTAQFQ